MTWTGQTFSVGQQLTAAQMTNLQDDITAAMSGDAGGPKLANAALTDNTIDAVKLLNDTITTAKLLASCVTQSKLNTSDSQVGTSIGSGGGSTTHSFGDARYSFSRVFWTDDITRASWTTDAVPSSNSTWERQVTHSNSGGAAVQIFTLERHVDASPPYDLGDGEIPLFIFVLIDKSDTSFKSVYVSRTPPWQYSGIGKTSADLYDEKGTGYIMRKDMAGLNITLDQALKNPAMLESYKNAFVSAPDITVELTQEMKNRFMNQCPHPFKGDLSNKKVIMIDPVSEFTLDMYEMMKHDKVIIPKLILDHVDIDNVALNRRGPVGVDVVGARWRNAL